MPEHFLDPSWKNKNWTEVTNVLGEPVRVNVIWRLKHSYKEQWDEQALTSDCGTCPLRVNREGAEKIINMLQLGKGSSSWRPPIEYDGLCLWNPADRLKDRGGIIPVGRILIPKAPDIKLSKCKLIG